MIKKITASVLALTMVFGAGTQTVVNILPETTVSVSAETLTYEDFEYTVLDDGTLAIIYYFGNDTEVEIPSEIDGKKITTIEEGAFHFCDGITNVIIPETVTSIGDYAFHGCYSLTSIVIPNKVSRIGESAFHDCFDLTTITISDSVNDIGSHAFKNTRWLENKISENPLVIINHILIDGSTCEGDIKIPVGVTQIGAAAFLNCENIASVIIPDGVTSIRHSAFWNCNKMTNVSIPESVTSIEGGAFQLCKSLTSISIPDGVRSIEYDLFTGCASLTDVMLPSSITSLGSAAFAGCINLTSIILPDNLIEIGSDAFFGCTSITSVTIPDTVDVIGENAFGYFYDYTSFENQKINDLIIYCYSGTAAEKYAIENEFDYELLDAEDVPQKGDITGDGKVDITDVTRLISHVRGVRPLEDTALGDLNGDKKVDITDVTMLIAHVRGVKPLE